MHDDAPAEIPDTTIARAPEPVLGMTLGVAYPLATGTA